MPQRPTQPLPYRRIVGWLVLVSLLAMLLVPHHYHLTHTTDAAEHGSTHSVSLHPSAGDLDIGNHSHDDHTVDASLTDISKPNNQQMPLIALLLVVLLLAPFGSLLRPTSYSRTPHGRPRSPRHRIPPLRAPPLF